MKVSLPKEGTLVFDSDKHRLMIYGEDGNWHGTSINVNGETIMDPDEELEMKKKMKEAEDMKEKAKRVDNITGVINNVNEEC